MGHRHHHCFSPHQLGCNPTTQRTICRRRSGMCEGPKNGRAHILSIQGAAASSFLALKGGRWSEETAVFIRQLAKARARQSFHTCTKWSRLPSLPDGPQSLLMPPSPRHGTKENHRIRSSRKKCSGHVPANFQFVCACRCDESSNRTCKQAVQLVERFLEPIHCTHNLSLP